MSVVYLLHLSAPMPQGDDPRTGKPRAATHYIGWAKDLDARLEHHRNGTGANILRHARERGITFTLARTWPGKDRAFERKLHNRKESPRICPICNPAIESETL